MGALIGAQLSILAGPVGLGAGVAAGTVVGGNLGSALEDLVNKKRKFF